MKRQKKVRLLYPAVRHTIIQTNTCYLCIRCGVAHGDGDGFTGTDCWVNEEIVSRVKKLIPDIFTFEENRIREQYNIKNMTYCDELKMERMEAITFINEIIVDEISGGYRLSSTEALNKVKSYLERRIETDEFHLEKTPLTTHIELNL